MSDGFRLSVAIPLHNEESVLRELLLRILPVLDELPGGPHELLFVDDGSTDRTVALVHEAAERDPRIVLVTLSRNFGHQAALSAALDHVTGDAVVVMDGDLQDIPEAIPRFVQRFHEGFDVVYAQRVGRKEAWPLRLCYFVFYRLMAKLSDIRLPLDTGDFGLMSRRVVDEIRRLPEHHRYLRGLRTWVGYRQTGIPVERSERHSGDSKYGFFRLLKLASDGIFAFSIVPIRAAAMLGAIAVGASMLFGIYAVLLKVAFNKSPQGFTALTPADHVSLRRAALFPWRHRRIRGPHLRGNQTAAQLHRWRSVSQQGASPKSSRPRGFPREHGGNFRRPCAPPGTMTPLAMTASNSSPAAPGARAIEYLSAPAAVSMADSWFEIASLKHFWVHRRFEVLRRLAGSTITSAHEMGEIGCGHGLLQRQVEDGFSKPVTGFDLNEYALKQNISRQSRVCCYDIFQCDPANRQRFDVLFLFDVLEHLADEQKFLNAVCFHLAPQGRLIVNVPAGQWAFSAYDVAAGHQRRYSMKTLAAAANRSSLKVEDWTYWGLPLVPTLAVRKLWLLGKKNESEIISQGFDTRSSALNHALALLSRCEPLPQKLLGTSLMAIFQLDLRSK